MNFVGIDIGSTASKVSVRGDKEINYVLPTGWSSKETANTIKGKLLEEGIDVESQDTKVVATGYGRIAVDYADYVITEITCHARGGREFAGNDCAVIDVGGQDTKVIILEDGMVKDFLMNDKCSAGTGKFLEIMANRLGVTLQELFEMADQGTILPISSLCTVFAVTLRLSFPQSLGKPWSPQSLADMPELSELRSWRKKKAADSERLGTYTFAKSVRPQSRLSVSPIVFPPVPFCKSVRPLL